MAFPPLDLLRLLLAGDVDGWNEWRRQIDSQKVRFTGVDLTGVDLTGVDLTGVNLTGVNLTDADLARTDLTRADLTDADLTRADLTGADLTGADLTGADLTDADLTRAYLTDAVLTGADLTGSNLTRAYLVRAVLTDAYLVRAVLTDADLTRADLTDADLARADLTGAVLTDAVLARADLAEAFLIAADLTGADLTGAKIARANNLAAMRVGGATTNPRGKTIAEDFREVSDSNDLSLEADGRNVQITTTDLGADIDPRILANIVASIASLADLATRVGAVLVQRLTEDYHGGGNLAVATRLELPHDDIAIRRLHFGSPLLADLIDLGQAALPWISGGGLGGMVIKQVGGARLAAACVWLALPYVRERDRARAEADKEEANLRRDRAVRARESLQVAPTTPADLRSRLSEAGIADAEADRLAEELAPLFRNGFTLTVTTEDEGQSDDTTAS